MNVAQPEGSMQSLRFRRAIPGPLVRLKVFPGLYSLQVSDLVIRAVVIAMVDMVPFGNRPVVVHPYSTMKVSFRNV